MVEQIRVSIEVGHHFENNDDRGTARKENGNVIEEEGYITYYICLELERQLKRHGVKTLFSGRNGDINHFWLSGDLKKIFIEKAKEIGKPLSQEEINKINAAQSMYDFEELLKLGIYRDFDDILNDNKEVIIEGISVPSKWAKEFTMHELKLFQPDVHIQVHVNSFNNVVRGFECYYYKDNEIEMPDRKKLQEKSEVLCDLILKYVKQIPGTDISRGKKPDLENSRINKLSEYYTCPGVYCETGFMDNDDDYATFNTKEKRKLYGEAYARAIIEYLGMKWIPEFIHDSAKRKKFYAVVGGIQYTFRDYVEMFGEKIPVNNIRVENVVNGKVIQSVKAELR